MRKVVILFSYSFLISALNLAPASAGFFGKTECEKVAAQISQQDQIGRSLWVSLDNAWKAKKKSNSDSENMIVVLATEDLFNQYASTLKIGITNGKCYKSEQVASMISYRTAILKVVSAAKTWESGKSWSGFWTSPAWTQFYTFKDFLKK